MRSGSGEKKAAAMTAAAPMNSSRKPIWMPGLVEPGGLEGAVVFVTVTFPPWFRVPGRGRLYCRQREEYRWNRWRLERAPCIEAAGCG